ncbi:MAG: gfo/Idh/MocA family oxidoreductase [Bacteroidetes bacterium]|nr:MAG: gfo/Idh/MocA family oxidoreductase [Bacteroidota bacterium]
MENKKYKVLVVGCGSMGGPHAKAYHKLNEFEIVGIVTLNPKKHEDLAIELGESVTWYTDFYSALDKTRPDIVSINTYPDTHADFVRKSLEVGAHVFVEKPLATTVKDAEEIVALALQKNKKLLVGYILRVHPAWSKFIQIAKTLGKPLVMRMNLNQQSSGQEWLTHKKFMKSISPLVDCGVHYVDVMCQMTGSNPVRVSAIGANLSDEIDISMYNYGQLQVTFEDGSVGWYETGWGPMMSETAFFVKDVIGPKGCVSIEDRKEVDSQDIEGHTKTGSLRLHHSSLDTEGNFNKKDDLIDTSSEPNHDELCELEQRLLLKAIKKDLDLSDHMQDAVNSLKIVLAADESIRTGKVVNL